MQSNVLLDITPSNMDMAKWVARRFNTSVREVISFCLQGSTNPIDRRLHNLREILCARKVQPTLRRSMLASREA